MHERQNREVRHLVLLVDAEPKAAATVARRVHIGHLEYSDELLPTCSRDRIPSRIASLQASPSSIEGMIPHLLLAAA